MDLNFDDEILVFQVEVCEFFVVNVVLILMKFYDNVEGFV